MQQATTNERPLKRIAALVPNVLGVSPGQRIRIEAWAEHLPQYGWAVNFYPFEDDALHEVLYQPGRYLTKATRMLPCYARQLRRVLQGPRCDALCIYREAALIGPAVIERLARRLGVPMVFDLDDPVFEPLASPTSGWLNRLKFPRKTHTLFRISDHVIAANRLVGDYARQYNPHVSVIPLSPDTERYRPADKANDGPVRVLWSGSHSTMTNLQEIAGPLRQFQATQPGVPLLVIGTGQLDLPGVAVEVRQWAAETEVTDLQAGDIGLVPVPNLPVNRFKIFMKTVQYMAVGLPVIAQKVGSNSEVIEDGVSGFVVETEDEWYDRLCLLARDHELRRRMGAAARQRVMERYSLQGNMPQVAAVFDELTRTRKAAA